MDRFIGFRRPPNLETTVGHRWGNAVGVFTLANACEHNNNHQEERENRENHDNKNGQSGLSGLIAAAEDDEAKPADGLH